LCVVCKSWVRYLRSCSPMIMLNHFRYLNADWKDWKIVLFLHHSPILRLRLAVLIQCICLTCNWLNYICRWCLVWSLTGIAFNSLYALNSYLLLSRLDFASQVTRSTPPRP
jgi:hypothetical protein